MILDLLGDARIISVDRGRAVLTLALDCANAVCLSAPVRELRFFEYSIILDAGLTGCIWHRHSLTAGPGFQTLELTVYVPSTKRKPPKRRSVIRFKRMEIISQQGVSIDATYH